MTLFLSLDWTSLENICEFLTEDCTNQYLFESWGKGTHAVIEIVIKQLVLIKKVNRFKVLSLELICMKSKTHTVLGHA